MSAKGSGPAAYGDPVQFRSPPTVVCNTAPMTLKVIGPGVGRTGTNSLKLALERLLGGRCHHMWEVGQDPDRQIPMWTAAIEGKSVEWNEIMDGFVAQVDWPGASFWPELTSAFPEALVVLSVRPADEWYHSASQTIFQAIRLEGQWRATLVKLLGDRFCDRLEDKDAMIEAYESHNAAVRRAISSDRLLEWAPIDGWVPLCDFLGVPIPDEPFPRTNTTAEFRQMLGLDAG